MFAKAFLRGYFRKKRVVRIILISIVFLIFLIGTVKIASSSSNNTDLTTYLRNSSTENISRTQSGVSKIDSISDRFSQKCDIPIKNTKFSLAHRFPHIIIIGFGKAGTRALYQMIRLNPDVVGPANELRFFSNDVKYKLGVHAYTRWMPPTTATQRTIEKSPDYIIKPVAAIRLKKATERCGRSKDIKFIVVLRDPFTRAVSEYIHWKLYLQSKGKTIRNFEKLAIKKSGQVNNLLAQVKLNVVVTMVV